MFVIALSCVLLILVLLLIHLVFNYNEKARLIRKIPGVKDTFIVGNAPELLLSRIELFKFRMELAKRHNGIYRFYSFPVSMVNIYNPDDIEKIISQSKFNEKADIYSFLKSWLGDGLLLSTGAKWRHRRKVLTPAFHFNMLNQFTRVFDENSRRIINVLESNAGRTIDVTPIVSEFTLNSICETAMGTQLSEENTEAGKSYKNAILAMGDIFVDRVIRVYYHFHFFYKFSTLFRREKKLLQTIHSFTTNVIKYRKETLEKTGNNMALFKTDEYNFEYFDDNSNKKKNVSMIDLLLSFEKIGLIDSEGVKEEVDTFMFEGHDTTSSALVFFLVEIAHNKQIQERLLEEQLEIFGNTIRPITTKDLSQMRYLECCIKESLRLYPPVHFISRQLNEAVTLSNYKVPAGTICAIHIFDLHRSEKLFKDPLKFDPDRFLPENCEGRHPYAYIPFSAGPRNCIGQRFAMMEMKTMLSAVLREFQLVSVTKPADLEFIADIVLRNSAPVYIKFQKRNIVHH